MSAFEKIERIKAPDPEPKATGLTFAAVALIAAVIFRDHTASALGLVVIAAILGGVSFYAAHLLKGLARLWGRFAQLLASIVNPIVMAMVFFGFITPYGLALRLVRDPLGRRCKPHNGSFWVEATGPQDKARMERQF